MLWQNGFDSHSHQHLRIHRSKRPTSTPINQPMWSNTTYSILDPGMIAPKSRTCVNYPWGHRSFEPADKSKRADSHSTSRVTNILQRGNSYLCVESPDIHWNQGTAPPARIRNLRWHAGPDTFPPGALPPPPPRDVRSPQRHYFALTSYVGRHVCW